MWADVEKLTIDYLNSANLGVPIATTVPASDRPSRFVRLQSGGSRRRTIVHRDTRVTVECWSSLNEEDASHLAELVYQTLDDWDLVPPFDGWQAGPYPQPDPDTGTPRYVMTVIIRHRMED
ncbi:MAG: hypothetical protein LBV06_07160 [Propionibacteriaceae bacterium]|jgi:hypothetical protein|nr:hypothetical protein [Propionibacteriaceae bacterium]